MAYLVSFCPFLCIGNLCLPSWALFHRSQKSQWQQVIGRPMPFLLAFTLTFRVFFLLHMHFLMTCLCFTMKVEKIWGRRCWSWRCGDAWLTNYLLASLTCFLKTTLAAPPSSLFVDYNFLPKCISEFCLLTILPLSPLLQDHRLEVTAYLHLYLSI